MNKVRANQIVAKALQVRKKYLNAGANISICPYNLADAMGFDIRFVNIPSFEGMYLADEGVILISADRPEGRKRFTCAHEIGHHVLGHGTVIDEIIELGSDREIEKEADFFAGMLLMPSSAIKKAASDAGVTIDSIDSKDAYIFSKYFGLSYTAFLTHLFFNLKLISRDRFNRLKAEKLANIKTKLAPIMTNNQIIVVDKWWQGKAVDIEVGDIIVVNNECEIEGFSVCFSHESSGIYMYEAMSPGISKLSQREWASFVRVCRKKYTGMFQFMHEEEVE